MWTSKDPTKKLFDSLLADFVTEGVPKENDFPDGWSLASQLQCSAALRLLYYFPEESTALVAKRLAKLDIAGNLGAEKPDDELEGRHYRTNGIDTPEFIRAVAWCKEPAIRAALTTIFRRTTDREILLAALDAVEDRNLIRGRLEPLIDRIAEGKHGEYGEDLKLLIALGERTPDTAKAVFLRYLHGDVVMRRLTVCDALRSVKPSWDMELLVPFRDDKREWPGYGTGIPGGKPTLPPRVCDEAAETLAANHPELSFGYTEFITAETYADRNKQIAAIREQLKGKK
jgi:hypothetical protein